MYKEENLGVKIWSATVSYKISDNVHSCVCDLHYKIWMIPLTSNRCYEKKVKLARAKTRHYAKC